MTLNMKAAREWFAESGRLTALLLRHQALTLGLLLIIGCYIDITAEDAMQSMSPDDETLRLCLLVGQGLWGLVEGILMLIILSWAVPDARNLPPSGPLLPKPFKEPYVISFLAE